MDNICKLVRDAHFCSRSYFADKNGMCLTIPKKVVSIDKGAIIVEDPDGNKQEVRTIKELKVGDYVLTQQRIVVEIIDEDYAQEILEIYRGKEIS